jgi:large subunit ribosomal protein L31e
MHKWMRGEGFKKRAPQVLKEIWKFVMKEIGSPDGCTDPRVNKAVWARGIRNVSNDMCVIIQKM